MAYILPPKKISVICDNFSMAYISPLKKIFVTSIWASIQLSSVISKFAVISETVQKQSAYYVKNITGDCWEKMFWNFKLMVSDLYKSYEYIEGSLDPEQREFFKSIRLNTAPDDRWGMSLKRLSDFLAWKLGRNVIVFIDEYEAPNNQAYAHGYSHKVRCSYPS